MCRSRLVQDGFDLCRGRRHGKVATLVLSRSDVRSEKVQMRIHQRQLDKGWVGTSPTEGATHAVFLLLNKWHTPRAGCLSSTAKPLVDVEVFKIVTSTSQIHRKRRSKCFEIDSWKLSCSSPIASSKGPVGCAKTYGQLQMARGMLSTLEAASAEHAQQEPLHSGSVRALAVRPVLGRRGPPPQA